MCYETETFVQALLWHGIEDVDFETKYFIPVK